MSYILDALKRSEQERHQDKVADLSADLLILQKQKQAKSRWPIVVVILLLINLLVISIFAYTKFFSGESQGLDISKSTETEDLPVNVFNKDANAASSAQADFSDKATKPEKMKSIPSYVQREVETKQISDLRSSQSVNSGVYESSASRSDISTGKSALSAASNDYESQEPSLADFEVIHPKGKQSFSLGEQPVVSMETDTNEGFNQVEIIRPSGTPHSPAKQPEKSQSYVAKPAHGDEAYFADVQHLSDMSIAFQKRIPNITFNSHIYSDQPSARRVMINNLYLREGEGFSGMHIKAIGEFYIHLEKDGADFKLPVLRDWVTP